MFKSVHDTAASAQTNAPKAAPSSTPYVLAYDKDGSLVLPYQYREWIYLTSGLGMSYSAMGPAMQISANFDNVFVNPEAYRSFLTHGTWPDKTVMVLEVRHAQSKGSINKSGHYQGDLAGMEIHLKDEARFPGKWAFFDVDKNEKGNLIPQIADCYSCHAQHAAVDTTFVQFYPTLLAIAKQKNTLSPAYLKEIQTPDAAK